MKEMLKVLLLLLYPFGAFVCVIFNGYPSLFGSIAMMLSVPLIFAVTARL